MDDIAIIDTEVNYLMVCLCDSNSPLFTACDHNPNTIPLKQFIDAGVQCLLYYKDEDGTIKPLRPQ